MDLGLEDDSEKLSKAIPVLSGYVEGLGTRVKERYLAKISVIGVDPASIPKEQFNGECLDIFCSESEPLYEKKFKAYKSLNAYNQMVSGLARSIGDHERKANSRKLLRRGRQSRVRHSQAMNEPPVDI